MKRKNWFWGIFFIAAAVLLVVGNLGILGAVNIWGLLFTVVFAATLVKSLAHKNVAGVLFSIAFLCIIYAKPLGITAITPWTVLGAALLGSIGVSFFYHPHMPGGGHIQVGDENFSDIETVEGEEIEFVTRFGGSIKYVNSEDFRSARVVACCGGVKLYLDNAVIQGEQAVLDLSLSYSGLELYVPKTWKIVNNTNVFMGGIEEKNSRGVAEEKTLVLRGEIKLSGIMVIYI
ncbi:hypothetical protein ABXS75_03920 [Roseburia hominis]